MVAKKKKRDKKPKQYVPKLSAKQYERYYIALEQGEAAAHGDLAVFWDLAGGERVERVLADMRHVAKKENIPVLITKGSGRSLKLFYTSAKPKDVVRVVRHGQVILETESSTKDEDGLEQESDSNLQDAVANV